MNTNAPLDPLVRHSRFYLRHNSATRLANLALTCKSLIRRPLVAPNMPISLKIEPSAMCQLACPGCPHSNPLFKIQTRGKTMSLELFRRIIEEAGRYLYRIHFYYYCEHFNNKHLLQMISFSTEHGIGSKSVPTFPSTFQTTF